MSDSRAMADVEMKDAPVEGQENQLTTSEVTLKFRNYYPRDEELRKYRLPELPDYSKEINERFDFLASQVDDETLLEMAPKKPNWDLKREVKPRFEQLERQTQRALLEIIREKVKQQGDDMES